nr:MAG TPA: Cytosine specific methyltransferase [Caudoviricetes sp.]
MRIIQASQPKIAIAENVKALTGKKFKNEFELVLRSLEEAGYSNYWKVLNAVDFGIPQNREREYS